MSFFSKILLFAFTVTLLAHTAYAAEEIYDRDLVRGFLSLKGDFRSMRPSGVKFINDVTGRSYKRNYPDGHVEIGAEYHQLRTWFDVDFMPLTQERGETEWFTYGVTWMWGYKLLRQNSLFNIIPSAGPGFELQNIRLSERERVISSFGPTLNLELELRLQFSQFSVGAYGGYKVVRHDGWDDASQNAAPPGIYEGGDINADKVFVGLKFSWTMLNNFQRKEKELL